MILYVIYIFSCGEYEGNGHNYEIKLRHVYSQKFDIDYED